LSESAAARLATLSLASKPKRNSAQCVSPQTGVEENDDENLLGKIGSGEREALSELFRRFARPIRGIGWRILRNNAEADDLVQEVFLYIHRKGTLFDSSRSSARSWIFQIAYTQAFLRRRRLKSGICVSGIADNLHEIELKTNSGADYDRSVEGLFGRTAWQRVLRCLSGEQRETLRLYFFEGYTFAEIAEKLGHSYANVRHHYYRGLEQVRKNLAENTLNGR
jgi:RNA polymerase sigma-70 factor (ECF subfamily)